LTARAAPSYDRAMAAPIIESPEAANRLARAIASDVALYNEEKVVQGLQQDTFFDVMAEHLEEGRELYRSRVAPQLYSATNFYERAIVDVIIHRKAHLRTKIW
jgi:hypothetical protein